VIKRRKTIFRISILPVIVKASGESEREARDNKGEMKISIPRVSGAIKNEIRALPGTRAEEIGTQTHLGKYRKWR